MVTKSNTIQNSSMGSRDRSLSMIDLSANSAQPIPHNPFGIEDSSDDPADSKVLYTHNNHINQGIKNNQIRNSENLIMFQNFKKSQIFGAVKS